MQHIWKRIPTMMCVLWNSFVAFLSWNISELPTGNVTSYKQKKKKIHTTNQYNPLSRIAHLTFKNRPAFQQKGLI